MFDPASRAGQPLVEVITDPWVNAREHVARSSRARVAGGGGISRYTDEVFRGREASPHYIPPQFFERLHDKMSRSLPRVASAGRNVGLSKFFEGMMPAGANFDMGAGNSFRMAKYGGGRDGNGGGGSTTLFSPDMPYLPEIASSDRQSYPAHRAIANTHWRTFFRLDGPTGTCIDMQSQLMFGEFDISGPGVEGSIKEAYERMNHETQVQAKLPFFFSEQAVVGEVAPHCFFDDSEGIWVHLDFHNPDHLEVIDSPFAFGRHPPIVRYQPDDRIRQVLALASTSPQIAAIRESMPDELVAAIVGRQHIELSPINFTFLPRKLFPYDVRGTSAYSRLWRDFMYEDGIYNASLSVARRVAAPLRVAKLGDAATMWAPTPEQEQATLERLVEAEVDPAAWFVHGYWINFELVGAQERAWKIEQTSEYIERKKLIVFGVSPAFLTGEVTFASTAGALTVMLQRLKTGRNYYEASWMRPKYYQPIAEMNEWYLPSPAEVSHHIVRSRRAKRELRERLIIPTNNWRNPLDPQIDSARLEAYKALETGLGVRISKASKAAIVHKDWRDELQQTIAEAVETAAVMKQLAQTNPDAAALLAQPSSPDGGGGMLPPIPPGDLGMPPPDAGGGTPPALPGGAPPALPAGPDQAAPPAPAGASAPGMHADVGDTGGAPTGTSYYVDGKYGVWRESTVNDLLDVLAGDDPEDDLWERLLSDDGDEVRSRIQAGDVQGAYLEIEGLLIDDGIPARDIRDLRTLLSVAGGAL